MGPQPFTLGVYYDADGDNDLLAGDLIAADSPRWSMWAGSGAPPEGWTAPGFDADGWEKVPRAEEAQLAALQKWQRRHFEEAVQAGRAALSVDRDELWLRVAFTARAVPR